MCLIGWWWFDYLLNLKINILFFIVQMLSMCLDTLHLEWWVIYSRGRFSPENLCLFNLVKIHYYFTDLRSVRHYCQKVNKSFNFVSSFFSFLMKIIQFIFQCNRYVGNYKGNCSFFWKFYCEFALFVDLKFLYVFIFLIKIINCCHSSWCKLLKRWENKMFSLDSEK